MDKEFFDDNQNKSYQKAFSQNEKRKVDPKDIFNNFLLKKRIFKNKEALSPAFVPESVLHRDSEIETISNILAPSLLLERISNVLIYGFSGTGKSLVTKYVAHNLGLLAADKNVNVLPVYTNCRLQNNDTEYRLISNLCTVFGVEVPTSGLSVNALYKKLVNKIDEEDKYIVLILDEIEKLIQNAGDGVLYSLLRLNESMQHAKISVIGISNNTDLKAALDQRVKSSLSPVELVFKPYNAIEIEEILNTRVKDSFYENALEEGVIKKCAALAAQEHGDVRKALNLLRVAGENAQQAGRGKLIESDLDKASEILEQNITEEMIKSMTKQSKSILYSIIVVARSKRMGKVYSGEVYDAYLKISEKYGLKKLTYRRISDLIADMDYNSLIMSRVKSNGRYGRTRELNIAFSPSLLIRIEEILRNDLKF
ncbi:MAG: AAA family ATPase [Candidatus Parvarchaeota archaeon]|jgi:cell division control protein 6|nr:AAA family ATPase [Candidatus Parvarchaeota archaeon]